MTHNVRVDEASYILYAAVAETADVLKIPWLVTGAASRVLLLEKVYGLPSGKATEDVDFAVMVESWEHYRAVVDRICKDEQFSRDPKQRQRIRGPEGSYLDLIPFGGIESVDLTIQWPPDNDFVMSVRGYREAYRDAVFVTLNDRLVVPVVSPAGLVLLKFMAWADRHRSQPGRDAGDLAYVLRHYSTIETERKLFDDHGDAIEAVEYDIDLAAAHVLGRHVNSLASTTTGEILRSLLEVQLARGTDSRLVSDITDWLPSSGRVRALELLGQFHAGLNDAHENR